MYKFYAGMTGTVKRLRTINNHVVAVVQLAGIGITRIEIDGKWCGNHQSFEYNYNNCK